MIALPIALFVIVLLIVWMWERGMVIAAFVIMGALLGSVVGFTAGVTLGPGPEAGAMYGIEQLGSGVVGGSVGFLIGSILGGTCGWAFAKWRKRRQHQTASSLSPSEHLRSA